MFIGKHFASIFNYLVNLLNHGYNMRNKLIIFCIVFLSLHFFIVGCHKKGIEPKNGQITLSWPSEPASFDLTKYNGANDLKLIWNIYEPLVRISKGRIVPAGAQSWSVSNDGLVYTFSLRENYWSDGQKVTAEHYVSTLRRISAPDSLYPFVSDFYNIKNVEKIHKKSLETDYIGAEAIDDNTLKITLENPDANFLASVELYPDRLDLFSKFSGKYGYAPDKMVSCGPFILAEWQHNSTLIFRKNDRYWNRDEVKTEEVVLRIIPDKSTEYMEFKARNIDRITILDKKLLEEFRCDDSLYEVKTDSAKVFMFIFNVKDKILSNRKIRQALSLTVSREEICKSLDNSLTTPAYGLVPPMTMVGGIEYRQKIQEPLSILAKQLDAKRLLQEGLKELGFGNPQDVTITINSPNDSVSQMMSEYYKQMWERVLGIRINIKLEEFATYKSQLWSGNYQMATTAWGGSLEPNFLLSRWLPGNQSQWVDQGYAKLIENAIRQTDEEKRLAYYAKAEKMLVADEAVIAPIKYDGCSVFYNRRVRVMDESPFDNIGFMSLSIDDAK